MSGRRAVRAALVVAGVVVGGIAGSALSASAAPVTGKTFPTKVADVHIRTLPRTGRGSRVVRVLPAARTPVTVACYVSGQAVGGDRIWYRTTAPATGYVPGFFLRSGHDPAAGIARCV